jgi:hypothetical protein
MTKDKVTAILAISMSRNMCIIKMGSFVSSVEEQGEYGKHSFPSKVKECGEWRKQLFLGRHLQDMVRFVNNRFSSTSKTLQKSVTLVQLLVTWHIFLKLTFQKT